MGQRRISVGVVCSPAQCGDKRSVFMMKGLGTNPAGCPWPLSGTGGQPNAFHVPKWDAEIADEGHS